MAAIAAEAYAVGSYVNTLIDGPDPRLMGARGLGLLIPEEVAHLFRMMPPAYSEMIARSVPI